MADCCSFCGSSTGPFNKVEGQFTVLMCADWQAAHGHGDSPYPAMTRAEMHAGLDLLPTWALEQKAAANRQVIAVMCQRLAAGGQVARMYQEPGLAWRERPLVPIGSQRFPMRQDLVRTGGSFPSRRDAYGLPRLASPARDPSRVAASAPYCRGHGLRAACASTVGRGAMVGRPRLPSTIRRRLRPTTHRPSGLWSGATPGMS